MVVESEEHFAHRILRWFDAHARTLPWRLSPGTPLPIDDAAWPYRVWLSEIMLQQTTVAAVKPYFEGFTNRWPNVEALASAKDADVMAAWAGLGYYARARNLLACARMVVAEYGGCFPSDEAALLKLPGVGAYTAAAIASIAFGRKAVVVDGNVERVIARHSAVATPVPAAKAEFKALAAALTPIKRSGDYAQAMMDLGATICTPRSPACLMCPVNADCRGRDQAESFPVKAPKAVKPHRTGICWWIERDGHIFLVTRAAKQMLGGMRALPSDDWDAKKTSTLQTSGASNLIEALNIAEAVAIARETEGLLGTISHVFTHFSLTLEIRHLALETGCSLGLDGEWWAKERLDDAGLPSLFVKAAHLALGRE
jgi:A/G-specific adenine glycosylase